MKFSELKKEAIIKLSGKMKKASCIYFLFIFLFIVLYLIFYKLFTNFLPDATLETVINIISNVLPILLIPFSFGILASMVKLSRNEDVKIFDFLKFGIKNIAKVFKVYIVMIIKQWKAILLYAISYILLILIQNNILVGIIPAFISLFLTLAALIMFIKKSLSYSLAFYILHDNLDDKASDILDRSEKLMNGYKFKIVLLDLSFIGWVLLIVLTTILAAFLSVIPFIETINNLLGYINTNIHSLTLIIGILLLLPYVAFTKVNFYEELISNEKIENIEN